MGVAVGLAVACTDDPQPAPDARGASSTSTAAPSTTTVEPDGEWEPVRSIELPVPVTSEWPVQDVDISDGPSAYAYGRIRLEADDELSFIVEGEGVVATFQPRTEPYGPDEICG